MSTSRDIEFEQGTSVGRARRHDGYYAGDFTGRPFPSREALRRLTAIARRRDAVAGDVVGGW